MSQLKRLMLRKCHFALYCFLVLGFFPVTAQSDDTEIRLFSEQGYWTIKSVMDPAENSFVRCYANTLYETGTAVSIGRNHVGDLELFLTNKSWALPNPQSKAVTIQVDKNKPLHVRIDLGTDGTAIIVVDQHRADSFLAQLRRGDSLLIQGEAQDLIFGLDGSNAALRDVQRCREEALEKAKPERNFRPHEVTNPFDSSRAKPVSNNSSSVLESLQFFLARDAFHFSRHGGEAT